MDVSLILATTRLLVLMVGIVGLVLSSTSAQDVAITFSDLEALGAGVELSDEAKDQPLDFHFSDKLPCACHRPNLDPGHPAKPRISRPGDRNMSDCPPKRYALPDLRRAGYPNLIAPWAKCAFNSQHYSAWYVGGGTPWILPHWTRERQSYSEGTWGMDYDGLFSPRRVWMHWSCDRHQGGIGQYETDFEPAFLKRL